MLQYLLMTPGFQDWNSKLPSAKDDWRFYQQQILRVDHALCYIDIFWPDFLELDGLVIRDSDRDIERVRKQFKQGDISPEQAEYILNHVHIHELFPSEPDIS